MIISFKYKNYKVAGVNYWRRKYLVWKCSKKNIENNYNDNRGEKYLEFHVCKKTFFYLFGEITHLTTDTDINKMYPVIVPL